jgi:hypothetical protein
VLVAAALVTAVLAGATSAAADSGLAYACSPPNPPAAANCALWHTGPVQVIWNWNFGWDQSNTITGNQCNNKAPLTFTADTTGTKVKCVVTDGTLFDGNTVTIYIDGTPPTVTGITPSRPPDNDGWWNHPVSFTFSGTDATSGIASCGTVNYSGPDGGAAPVTGSCRDVAGNSAQGSFPIEYDSTPPSVLLGATSAGNARTTLRWATSPDVVQTTVSRSPGMGGAQASQVYSGAGPSYTDHALRNGTPYTYTVTAVDAAANAASATVTLTPKAPPPALPRLRWRRVKGADYYNVQLYKNGRKLLSAWPHGNHLQLKRSWTYRGHRRSLKAGRYDWYAWPGYGRRSQHRYGHLIAHKQFRIKSPS